jgi:hypothetical protein
MTTLAEIPFKELLAGMIFKHPKHGEQIILDLGRNNFGPIIKFHNCEIYSGKLPETTDDEIDIFEILARTTYPSGTEDWEYLRLVPLEQIYEHGWQWFEVACPHCTAVHRLIASTPPYNQTQCLVCGMVHSRPFILSVT